MLHGARRPRTAAVVLGRGRIARGGGFAVMATVRLAAMAKGVLLGVVEWEQRLVTAPLISGSTYLLAVVARLSPPAPCPRRTAPSFERGACLPCALSAVKHRFQTTCSLLALRMVGGTAVAMDCCLLRPHVTASAHCSVVPLPVPLFTPQASSSISLRTACICRTRILVIGTPTPISSFSRFSFFLSSPLSIGPGTSPTVQWGG